MTKYDDIRQQSEYNVIYYFTLLFKFMLMLIYLFFVKTMNVFLYAGTFWQVVTDWTMCDILGWPQRYIVYSLLYINLVWITDSQQAHAGPQAPTCPSNTDLPWTW